MRNDTGWTLKSRHGLKYLLTNPMYIGHLVFKERIIKLDAHAPIVDVDNWYYAMEHLSDVNPFDNKPIAHNKRTVRYAQTDKATKQTALLSGTRDNGKLVIDGVNGAHVYYNSAMKAYLLLNRVQTDEPSVYGFETSIQSKELDAILETHLLEKLCFEQGIVQVTRDSKQKARDRAGIVGHSALEDDTPLVQAMNAHGQEAPQGNALTDELKTAKLQLTNVQRRITTSIDVMSDEQQRATYESEDRLLKRVADLEEMVKNTERIAREREQAEEDIQDANEKWASWSIEKRRGFIRLVTDSIVLEELAQGWLRLTIVWSALISASPQAEYCHMWRQSGSQWKPEEVQAIHELYPSASRNTVLQALPSRSWLSIIGKAQKEKVARRGNAKRDVLDHAVPDEMSLSDNEVLKTYALKPDERVQWQPANDKSPSR